MNPECSVCCENFNGSTRICVECPDCSYQACRTCIRKYLLLSTKPAHCMSCSKEWSRELINIGLARSFVYGAYKKHRESLMLETEKARLVEDVDAAAQVKIIEKKKEENRKLKAQLTALKLQIRDNENELWRRQRIVRGELEAPAAQKKREFIQKCPGQNCNGMLSTQWKCKICELVVCAQCHEIKEDPAAGGGGGEHICKQENIDSIQFMKKDSKKCPQCGVPIHKISGCDQMWCVSCHIAFSWKTGTIVTHGIVHNPHFMQYQKELAAQGIAPAIARTAGDVPCGGLPAWWDFRAKVINQYQPKNARVGRYQRFVRENARNRSGDDLWAQLHDIYRNAGHLQYTIVDALRGQVNGLKNNKDLRIKFILGQISENHLASTVSRRALQTEKATAMLHIYELMNTIITENIVHMYNNPTREICELSLGNCHRIRLYANEELKKVSVIYGQSVKILDRDFNAVGVKYNQKTLKKEQAKMAATAKVCGITSNDVQHVLDSLDAII